MPAFDPFLPPAQRGRHFFVSTDVQPGMKGFRVRLTRDGEDVGLYFLLAFDEDDAVTRAKDMAARSKERHPACDNPFENPDGLEAWVRALG